MFPDEASRMVKGGAADPVYVVNETMPPSDGAATQATLEAVLARLVDILSDQVTRSFVIDETFDPLGADGEYTGAWISLTGITNISVAIATDQDSATNGLVWQWSMDGVLIDDTDPFSVSAGNTKQFTFGVAHLYGRVYYKNGATPQGTMRLQVQAHTHAPKPSSHKIQHSFVDEDDGTLVLAVPKLRTAHDDYISQQATSAGNAKVSLEEVNGVLVPVTTYALEVARGNVTGVTSVNKFGAAPSGVQTTTSDIWSRCDSTPTQQIWLAPTAARVHAIASTDDNDGKTGSPTSTGARTIRIYGLRTWDTAEQTEDVTLDGTTPVNTANSYVIIHRMNVLTCGTSGPNIGTISATAAVDGTVTAIISPGDGQTEMAIYGVPSIQDFYLTRWSGAIGKSTAAASITFELRVNENPNVQTVAFLRKNDLSVQSTGSTNTEKILVNPAKYSGPCIIKVQGLASANDTDGKSAFDGFLVTK